MVLDVFAKALAISKVFYRDWYSSPFHKLKSSFFFISQYYYLSVILEGKSLILVFHKAPFLVLISSYYALMIFARVLFVILFSLICDSSGFYRNFCFSKNTFQHFYCEDSCNNDIKIRGYLYHFFTYFTTFFLLHLIFLFNHLYIIKM